MSHLHTVHDVLPNTVTLCAVEGLQWAHLTLPVSAWDEAGEELREWHRKVVRERADLGPEHPVTVVREEDLGRLA